MNSDLKNIVTALFEARYLKRIQKSGTSVLLGPEVEESIPEHSYYVSLLGIVMHYMNPKLDLGKLLTMCLTHDLEEVRTSDLNLVNKLYHQRDVSIKAFEDMWQGSKLGGKLSELQKERVAKKSLEAVAASDCDTLAELFIEKEYQEKGNTEADEWIEFTKKRLKTSEGKRLAEAISDSKSSQWWEEIKNKIRKKHGIKTVDYS